MTTTVSHRPNWYKQSFPSSLTIPVGSHALIPSLSRRTPTLIPFTSSEGKSLFRSAMSQGQTESFFKLLGNFSAQSSPDLAGISSLTMALNALEIDPKTIWKGNWRWYSGDQLKPCSPKEHVVEHGIPFDEFICLAQPHCNVDSFRVSFAPTSYEQFLQTLEQVTSDASSQMIVHYSRSALGQKGRQQDAHYSPVGAHNASRQQTLIMDVDRVHHPSVWVNTRDLYHAMLKSDPSTGLPRGYFVLKPGVNSKYIKCQECTNRACQV
ncbi:Phytochelatin synthase-domain-containing protein [Halteromyces radiatus]|uniref:Phytochelatin synthase-domain-containing protein n=1 Tax=Halteromyces radiatus TaxID=101107 RepID=UPI002220AEB0|nr:Phytochelatin synthase-domain-containing protein [Halteromyces radiatus]KAI8098643.1 Phytochelatin synthase-domain-containing protein [Halteromyces radiatus]